MSAIIADTTVWIDLLAKHENPQSKILEQTISSGKKIVLCPIILQEILQGIRDDVTFEMLKEHLLRFEMLYAEPVELALESAQLYRGLRKKGITIRKAVDCIIATYAIIYNIELLHRDGDFDKIAKYSKLKIVSI
ncbi:MAG: PIN domain-containing protein [Chitinophagales bacterium]|nr:PIN domain-containing protein [Chitinophagales bacterium]